MADSAADTAPVTGDTTIAPDSWVLISGLKTDHRLNGACGKVLKAFDPTKGKYTVRAFLSPAKHDDVLIRPANVAPVPASDMIETVRIACDGERAKFLQSLLFPRQHPMFSQPGNAPVPALLGMPLTVKKVTPVNTLGERADYDNRFATFLMVAPVSGFAPPEWQSYVGPVHVWRPGGEHLTIRDVDVLYDYIYGTLMDLYSERALKPAQHLVPAALRRARLERFPDERPRGTGAAQAPAPSSAASVVDGEAAFEIATRFEKGPAAGAPAKDVSKAIDFYWQALEAGNKKATPRLQQLLPALVLQSGQYPSLRPFADKTSWADVRSSPELREDLLELVDELQAHTDALAEEPFRGDIEGMRATAIALGMPNRTAYLRFLTPANVERMRRLYYHPYDRAVARRVGQELCDEGGAQAMSAVYYLFMWTTPYATASRRAGTCAAELFEQAKTFADDSAAAEDMMREAAMFRRREMALLGYPKDVQRMWDGIGDWRD